MADISSIDKALAVKTTIGREDITWHDPAQAPFRLYGVRYEDGLYRRMPESVAKTVNPGVADLAINTAGGRVCFATDSDCVAISSRRPSLWKMPHMALAGSAGLNLYIRKDGKLVYYVDSVVFAVLFAFFTANTANRTISCGYSAFIG